MAQKTDIVDIFTVVIIHARFRNYRGYHLGLEKKLSSSYVYVVPVFSLTPTLIMITNDYLSQTKVSYHANIIFPLFLLTLTEANATSF